jgi:hypothetical protein
MHDPSDIEALDAVSFGDVDKIAHPAPEPPHSARRDACRS